MGMVTVRSLLLTISLIVLIRPASAQTAPKLEVLGSKWEKGIAEVTLVSKYPAQRSGVVGESILTAQCQGLLQKVSAPDGKAVDILRNSTGTLVGFNFKPATEVNLVYLIISTNHNELRVFQNLSALLVPALAAVQLELTEEDRDYFFLTKISEDRLTIEFRGQKVLKPPTKPFTFDMQVLPDGQLRLIRNSVIEIKK
jgi:hypothetical protein